jgi:hypothetical protein
LLRAAAAAQDMTITGDWSLSHRGWERTRKARTPAPDWNAGQRSGCHEVLILGGGDRMPEIEGVALKRCIPSRNELAPSSLSFWTFSLVSRPMPSPDQSDDGPNGAPE